MARFSVVTSIFRTWGPDRLRGPPTSSAFLVHEDVRLFFEPPSFFFFPPGFFYFINSCVVFRMKKASQSVNSIYCLSHTSFDWLLTIIWTPNLSLIIFLHMFVMFLESLTLSSAYPPQGMNKQFPPPAMLSSRLFTWLTFHLPAWVTLPESPSLATRCKWLFLLFPSSWL